MLKYFICALYHYLIIWPYPSPADDIGQHRRGKIFNAINRIIHRGKAFKEGIGLVVSRPQKASVLISLNNPLGRRLAALVSRVSEPKSWVAGMSLSRFDEEGIEGKITSNVFNRGLQGEIRTSTFSFCAEFLLDQFWSRYLSATHLESGCLEFTLSLNHLVTGPVFCLYELPVEERRVLVQRLNSREVEALEFDMTILNSQRHPIGQIHGTFQLKMAYALPSSQNLA